VGADLPSGPGPGLLRRRPRLLRWRLKPLGRRPRLLGLRLGLLGLGLGIDGLRPGVLGRRLSLLGRRLSLLGRLGYLRGDIEIGASVGQGVVTVVQTIDRITTTATNPTSKRAHRLSIIVHLSDSW
jgi:hypothetical protein